ncbi:hypothetical protein LMG27174_01712 [Paraburkholderia rhynchosiae]|uniref:Uncharacterized protein n=1 Tax=Paraburkholderia rhynchosiae TaxID=487049 RepID=A0A6J5AC15_9BURK|nr:hypothetical protein LMG27174_01712 [Paraburkholderia rhynchosiae]
MRKRRRPRVRLGRFVRSVDSGGSPAAPVITHRHGGRAIGHVACNAMSAVRGDLQRHGCCGREASQPGQPRRLRIAARGALFRPDGF